VANEVVVNAVAGTVTILATDRQHALVQQYLDAVMSASQRQVLIEATIVEVGGNSLEPLLAQYLRGTDWFDESLLGGVGLKLMRDHKATEKPAPRYTGIVLRTQTEPPVIQSVLQGSPAEVAGLAPDDILIAANGYRINQDNWPLFTTRFGDKMRLHAFHQGILVTAELHVSDPHPDWWHFVAIDSPDTKAKARFESWIGRPYPFDKA
jgi:predicted metalloprotease with PDZ domain